MLIESISVKHFGLLHHFELKVGDKLNVIEGSNESGKSTLSAFIRFMFYGFPDDEAGRDERHRRTSWDTGTAEGEMVVKVGGRRYRIDRYSAITRNMAGGEEFRDRTRTVDLAAGSLVTEGDAGEYFLGVPNDVYVSSAFISQLDDTRVGEERMREQITNLLFSGDEKLSAKRAAEILRARREAVLAKAGEKGDLNLLRREAQELITEQARAKEVNRTLLSREAELVALRREKAALGEELARLERLKNSFKTVAVINSFDKLHNLEREQYLLEAEEAEYRLGHAYGDFMPDASFRTELVINHRVAKDAYAAFGAARGELEALRDEEAKDSEREKTLFRIERRGDERVASGFRSIAKKRTLLFSCAAGAAALALLFLILTAGPLLSFAVGGALMAPFAVCAIVCAFLGFRRHRAVKEYAADYGFSSVSEFAKFLEIIPTLRAAFEERARALRRAEESCERAKRTYLATISALQTTVARWGRTLPETGIGAALEAMLAEIDEIMAKAEHFRERHAALAADIAALRGRLAGENETMLRESLSPELRETLCDMSFEEILQGIKSRVARQEELERIRVNMEDEISGLRAAAQNPVELEEKVHILKEKITDIRELQYALTLAESAVSGAEENLRREITPRLTEYARRLMSAMTDGKYDTVGVGEDLLLEFSREGTGLSVEYLSGGTRDLAYIALRLAYIDLLYRETPPLVFDESFAHQDNFRATCTMKALRVLAEDGVQSLIFTCRSREATIAREVDRKYRHIKMEKLRAEAAETAAAISAQEEAEAASAKTATEAEVTDDAHAEAAVETFAVPEEERRVAEAEVVTFAIPEDVEIGAVSESAPFDEDAAAANAPDASAETGFAEDSSEMTDEEDAEEEYIDLSEEAAYAAEDSAEEFDDEESDGEEYIDLSEEGAAYSAEAGDAFEEDSEEELEDFEEETEELEDFEDDLEEETEGLEEDAEEGLEDFEEETEELEDFEDDLEEETEDLEEDAEEELEDFEDDPDGDDPNALFGTEGEDGEDVPFDEEDDPPFDTEENGTLFSRRPTDGEDDSDGGGDELDALFGRRRRKD